MDASRLLTVALLTAVAAAVVLPSAAAHSPAFSADGKVRASIGLLNEPVSTYAVTGLDLCFSQNVTAPRPAVNVVNPADLRAVLTSPSGAVHEQDLEVPFGRANCVTFADPLVLTEPGQYLVDLSGSIDGSTFDARGILAGGSVIDRARITFPATDVPSDVELQQRIAALEARLATLEAGHGDDDSKGAPLPAAAWLMVGLAALAAMRRLR